MHTLIILSLIIGLLILIMSTPVILWTYWDYPEAANKFTLLNVDILVMNGTSPLRYRSSGAPIIGKFLSIRVIALGAGVGVDILLKKKGMQS